MIKPNLNSLKRGCALALLCLTGYAGQSAQHEVAGALGEFFEGIGGVNVTDLTGSPKFPNGADSASILPSLETPTNRGDNYGGRVQCLITSANGGDYRIAIATDDHSELWLSTDDNPINKVLISREPDWAGVREYTGNSGGRRPNCDADGLCDNVSASVSLAPGVQYYLEALFKEGGGGDNLAITAWIAGDVPPGNGSAPLGDPDNTSGITISWFVDDCPVITQQPQSKTVLTGGGNKFSVKHSLVENPTYQWYQDGNLIVGADQSSYAYGPATSADNGAKFKCEVTSGACVTTSDEAVLTIVDPICVPCFLGMDAFLGIGGNAVTALTSDPRYPFAPDESFYITTASSRGPYPDDSHEAYGGRISGFLIVPESGLYRLFLHSDDAGVVNLGQGADPTDPASAVPVCVENACCTTFHEPTGAPDETSDVLDLAAGQKYFFEVLWKEGTGGDYGRVAIRKEGDPTPASQLPTIPPGYLAVNAVPGGTITIGQQPRVTAPSNPANIKVNTRITLAIDVTSDRSPMCVQWRKNGDVIIGANGPTYTTPLLTVADSTTSPKYDAVISVIGAVKTSATVTVPVFEDTAKPTIASVRGSSTFDKVVVTFSEPVSDSALATGNYGLDGGLAISDAVRVGLNSDSIQLTTSLQTPGTLYKLTVNRVEDTVSNVILADSMATFQSFSLAPGLVNVRFKSGSSGLVAGRDLIRAGDFTEERVAGLVEYPTGTLTANPPGDVADNYTTLISGYFIPPTSGPWVFFIATDDPGELWLSTDEDPINIKKVAMEPNWSGIRDWRGTDRRAGENRSDTFVGTEWREVDGNGLAVINLEPCKRYYFEVVAHEFGGGDNAAMTAVLQDQVTPTFPPSGYRPANGKEIATYVDPTGVEVSITQQPQNVTQPINSTATFSVAATSNRPLIFYQWQRNQVDICGATDAAYTTDILALTDNNAKFRCIVNSYGKSAISDEVTLTVIDDKTGPDCPVAAGTRDFSDNIIVTFNELVDGATAALVGNYSSPTLTIISATLNPDGKSVTLVVSPALATPGSTASITLKNATDLAGNKIVPDPCTFVARAWQYCYGAANRDFFFNIGGVAIPDLTGDPRYPNTPDVSNLAYRLESPEDNQDANHGDIFNNYGTRVSGWLIAPVSGFYTFWTASDDHSEFWLSTDADPANKVLICREPEWNGTRNWTLPDRRPGLENVSTTLFPDSGGGEPTRLVAGATYYFEALMKEGGGGDNLAVTWQTPAGGPQPNVPANGAGDGTPAIGGKYMVALVAPGDLTGPTVVSCKRGSSTTQVIVEFNEKLWPATAETAANYTIDHGVTVSKAVLRLNGSSVELTTSDISDTLCNSYALNITGVKDCVGNAVLAGTVCAIDLAPGYAAGGANNMVVVEVENYDSLVNLTTRAPWGLETSLPGYSGTGYMASSPNTGTFHGNANITFTQISHRMDYAVNFPAAGTYYVWVRGSSHNDGGNNSCHFGLDGASPNSFSQRVGNGTANWGGDAANVDRFGWVKDAQASPARLNVPTPGRHCVNIWAREDGMYLDQFVLTQDANFAIGQQDPPLAGSPRAAVGPVLKIKNNGDGSVTVEWTAGVLQVSDNVTGPWVNAAPASASPLTTPMDRLKRFARVLCLP